MLKRKKWAQNMNSSSLNTKLKRKSFFSQIVHSFQYSLGVIQITRTQSSEILSTVLPTVKHAFYLASTFSNDIMMLQRKYGGYNVPNLYLKNVAENIKMFISSIRMDENTGKKMKILIDCQQLESGLSSSILTEKGKIGLGYITKTWLTELIERLQEFQLYFKFPHWSPQCKEEDTIMDILTQRNDEIEFLKKANLCRQACKQVYISDLYDA